MIVRLPAIALVVAAALCSGCVAYPAYPGYGYGYYGPAVVVGPPVVVGHGYYGYRRYGGRGYGGHGPYRHW